MKTVNFVKVNLKSRGYKILYLNEEKDILDIGTIDKALPHPIRTLGGENVAYSITRISGDRAILAVGIYWPQYADEYERNGLYFWYGLVVALKNYDGDLVNKLSLKLHQLVNWHESNSQVLGKIIAMLATKTKYEKLIKYLFNFCLGYLSVEEFRVDKTVIKEINERLLQIPEASNIQFSLLPNYYKMYCITKLFLGKAEVGIVAGGELSVPKHQHYSYLSAQKYVPGYKDFLVA